MFVWCAFNQVHTRIAHKIIEILEKQLLNSEILNYKAEFLLNWFTIMRGESGLHLPYSDKAAPYVEEFVLLSLFYAAEHISIIIYLSPCVTGYLNIGGLSKPSQTQQYWLFWWI